MSDDRGGPGAGSTFITQPRINLDEYPADEVNELEALVSGVTQTSQSTLLLKKRKKLQEMDDALEAQKEVYRVAMAKFAERQQKFEEKQSQLRNQVASLAPFLQENDAKRKRALARAKEEEDLCRAKQAELQAKQQELEALLKRKEQLQQKLRRLRRYEDFLQRVVEDPHHGDAYTEVGDVLKRHMTLDSTFRTLRTDVQAKEQQIDRTRESMRVLVQEVQNHVLVKNSEIHASQKRLEQLKSEWFKHDLRKEQSDRAMKDKIRESGQVVMSIRNLHGRCVTSFKVKHRDQRDKAPGEGRGLQGQGKGGAAGGAGAAVDPTAASEEQVQTLSRYLVVVQHRLQDLDAIVREYRRAQAELAAEKGGGSGSGGAAGAGAGSGGLAGLGAAAAGASGAWMAGDDSDSVSGSLIASRRRGAGPGRDASLGASLASGKGAADDPSASLGY